MRDYIERVIKPKLQGDGGEIDFVSYENGVLTVLLQGECSKCLILHRCEAWIVSEIKRDLGLEIELCGIRKKPYLNSYVYIITLICVFFNL